MIQQCFLKFLIHDQKDSEGVNRLFITVMHDDRVHSC